MPQLIIEKPCNESWRKMRRNDDGRFCLSCQKTVVDFTGKTKEEIIDFLKAKNGEEVCGRCRTDQVISTVKTFSRFRWMAGLLSFVFGLSLLTSCYRKVQGCMAYDTPPKHKKHQAELKTDSVPGKNIR